MSLLAGKLYDPGTAVAAATSSLLALTALDSTNLRLTFVAPANGSVMVRLTGNVTSTTVLANILLGVIENSPSAGTVRGRVTPIGTGLVSGSLATEILQQEAQFVVTGLTAGTTYVWDAAYGVELVGASTNLKYGGPNNASGANAWGAIGFEVWDCLNLLAGTLYDPGAAASFAGTSLQALTAFDTTNLRLTFTGPASGNVYWHLRVTGTRGTTVWGQALLGIVENSPSAGTLRGRVAPVKGMININGTNSLQPHDASGVVTGLTSGTTYVWDAAVAVQTISASAAAMYRWGGPNDTTTNNAWGGFSYEIYAV